MVPAIPPRLTPFHTTRTPLPTGFAWRSDNRLVAPHLQAWLFTIRFATTTLVDAVTPVPLSMGMGQALQRHSTRGDMGRTTCLRISAKQRARPATAFYLPFLPGIRYLSSPFRLKQLHNAYHAAWSWANMGSWQPARGELRTPMANCAHARATYSALRRHLTRAPSALRSSRLP